MKNYIVYKTTNKKNNKIYIGVHKQEGEDFDGYLGSGSAIMNAVRKLGKENFSRETLFSYETLTEAFNKEEELVTVDFIKEKTNYNLCVGGRGYNIDENLRRRQEQTKIEKYGGVMGQCQTPEVFEKIYETNLKRYGNKYGNFVTKETWEKSRETFIKRHGSFSSLMKNEKSLAARSKTLREKYINKEPIVELLHDFLDSDSKIIFSGSLFELQDFMLKSKNLKPNLRTLIKLSKENKSYYKGPWKGYSVVKRSVFND